MIKNKNYVENGFFFHVKDIFDGHPIIKFIIVAILIVFYFLFTSFSHGIEAGFLISILTWSFFVLSTPIADAGILIDLPVRLITGIKMLYSEIVVWFIAISLNLFVFFTNPQIYNKTILLSLFGHILKTPFPYWGIIFLSAVGTFLSVYTADTLINSKTKEAVYSNLLIKHKIIVFVSLILLVIALYNFLLNKLGIQIPLF